MVNIVPFSLEKMCLLYIIENFELYHSAFTISTSHYLQMTLEALARTCSEDVLTVLIANGKLKEEYFNFLINPYICKLDIEGIQEELVPALVDRLQAMGENKIVFLKTAFQRVQLDDYKRLISCLEKVEVIEMSKVIHPEVMLEISKRCTLLRELNLLGSNVDDIGIMNIFANDNGEYENKPQLEQVDLPGSCNSVEVICFVLRHAPSLKCLNSIHTVQAICRICFSDLRNKCFDKNAKYSLTKLTFPQWLPNVEHAFEICIALCPDVSTIMVTYLGNDISLAFCSGFAKLKEISILPNALIPLPNTSYSFKGVKCFLKLKGKDLSKLFIQHHCVSALSIIEHCPNLRLLELYAVQFMPLDEGMLFPHGKLSHLELLSFTYFNFSVKEIQDSLSLLLLNAPNLIKLDFSGVTGLTADFIDSISHLGLLQVRKLKLSFTDVTFASVTDLLRHGSLETLEIVKCTNMTPIQNFYVIEIANIYRVGIAFGPVTLFKTSTTHCEYDCPERYEVLNYHIDEDMTGDSDEDVTNDDIRADLEMSDD